MYVNKAVGENVETPPKKSYCTLTRTGEVIVWSPRMAEECTLIQNSMNLEQIHHIFTEP